MGESRKARGTDFRGEGWWPCPLLSHSVTKNGQLEPWPRTISALVTFCQLAHSSHFNSSLSTPHHSLASTPCLPGKSVQRILTSPQLRCFSSGGSLPQNMCSAQIDPSDCGSLGEMTVWVEAARPRGLFLFYVHPVALATGNRRRHSITY